MFRSNCNSFDKEASLGVGDLHGGVTDRLDADDDIFGVGDCLGKPGGVSIVMVTWLRDSSISNPTFVGGALLLCCLDGAL